MSQVILSICIPTYNRPNRISFLIKQIISIQSNEIEIVIVDDNPSNNRTKEVISRFEDPRIKYFKNKKNLGYDANVLKTINKAEGEFIFLLMDDDDIEITSIPWILSTIKSNTHLTRLCGQLGNRRSDKYKIYYRFEDKLLKKGYDSLTKLLFFYSHGSGIILKKNTLDLNKAKEYIGCLFIQQALVAQAMIAGDTLCSSKIFAYIRSTMEESDQILIRGRRHWHPTVSLHVLKFNIKLTHDITKGIKNSKEIKAKILDRLKLKLIYYLYSTLFYDSLKFQKNIKAFLDGLLTVIMMKEISRSLKFWINLLIALSILFLKNKSFDKFGHYYSLFSI